MANRIDLRACRTVVLNVPGQDGRRAAATSLCHQLGLDFEVIDAIQATPGRIGCGLSHIKALRAWPGDRPLLVLEDDVAAGEGLRPVYDAPDDADALYVGISRYGAVEPIDYVGFVDAVASEPAAPGLLRIHNVLGSHAIVHLTPRWRTAAIEALTHAMVDLDWDPDRGLAMIQGDHNVYALREPAFYQAAALQSGAQGWMQEAATRAFGALPAIGDVLGLQCGVERRVKLTRDGQRLRWVLEDELA